MTLKMAIKEVAWRKLRKTSKQLIDWNSATAAQLSVKAEESRLFGGLEHHRLHRAATGSVNVDLIRYWIGMAEETKVVSGTDDFDTLSQLNRCA